MRKIYLIHINIILQGIFEELMLNFHESPQGIIGFLEIISEYDSIHLKGNFSNFKEK